MDYDEETEALDKAISNYVNGFGMHRLNKLAELMTNDHPTLQQGKMRLFVAFVREMAKKQYTDARNENSVALAKKLVKDWGEYGPALPTI